MNERNILLAGLAAFLLLATVCIWLHTSDMSGMNGPAVAAPGANLAPPRFGLRVNGGKVTLTGTVPDDAAKAALIKRANEVYGTGNYVDEIKVAAPGTVAAATPDWLKWASGLMNYGKTPNFEGSLDLNGKSLTASGSLHDESSLNKLATDLKAGVGPEVTFTNRLALHVGGPAPATGETKPLSEDEAKLQQSLNEQLKAAGVIEFAVGSAVITPAGKTVLDKLLPGLKNAGSASIQVEGHTDNQGNADKNLALSQQRAEAVKKYLSENGVKAENLTAKGFGPNRPLADNATPAGRQRNRRIEFNIVGK